MKNKQDNITKKLQNLVKRKHIPLVVIKVGSTKRDARTSNSTSIGEYYPSYNEE
jgi:hypothetical protein